jgi:hypothetical protein
MDENRNLVNNELKDTFDGGLVSIANQQSENFVELPKQEQANEETKGTVVNNFNVNVDVSSASAGAMASQKANATKIVNNILNTTNPNATPDEIKKNSTENSNPDGNSNVKVIENEQSPIRLIERSVNTGPDQPILDIRQIDYYSPDKPSDYGYSGAKLKSENVDLKRNYEMLHFLTQNSISEHLQMSPSASVLQTEFSNNLKEMNFNYFEKENISVDKSKSTMHDSVSSVSRENDRRIALREKERDESLNEMVRNNGRSQNNELEFSEIMNGNDISGNVVSGAKPLYTSGVRDFNNMSSRSTTIPLFIDKMNSPPIWRTVLG